MNQDDMQNLSEELHALAYRVDSAPTDVIDRLPGLVHGVYGSGPLALEDRSAAAVLLRAAGILIDAAVRERVIPHLVLAEAWLVDVVNSHQLDETNSASEVLYFLSNARIAVADLHWAQAAEAARAAESQEATEPAEPAHDLRVVRAVARWDERGRLRASRRDLAWSAALTDDGGAAGMRLCNLANTLDHSGRWIEAYDAYVGALAADPTNGNAAGNAAVLIERTIASGWDFEGHLCSLYDRYLSMAKSNRDRTIQVAGEHAARKFDEMELLGSHEPLRVDPDTEDAYQKWVTEHRLALIAGLEGLGAGEIEGRWDTITLRQVIQDIDETDAPPILSILNVLKADYLVARRLAFEACHVAENGGGWAQETTDPGVYVETLQYAVVGEVSAKLVLAHRAALDVLDKTAVAVNEHLSVGDDPDRVSFRTFWFEPKTDKVVLRTCLLAHPSVATGVIAMAELAYDMTDDGVYAEAQVVRNAGTHRFVLLHHGLKEVASTLTMQAMTLQEMVATTLDSLAAARAAFIYLVAMLSAYEADKAEKVSASGVLLSLPMVNTL